MKIEKTVNGDTMTMAFDGWLNSDTAPDLKKELENIGDDISSLVFDFRDVEYVSSAGIRMIVAAHKQMKGNFVIKNVASAIMDLFNMTGIGNKIRIEEA